MPEIRPVDKFDKETKAILTNLVDFIHTNKLPQFVNLGVYSHPFSRAVAVAYKKRHGGRLSIFNIGNKGKVLWTANPTSRDDAHAILRSIHPKLDPSKRTLLFEQVVLTGQTLSKASGILGTAGTVYRTAGFVVMKNSPVSPHFTGKLAQNKFATDEPLNPLLLVELNNEYMAKHVGDEGWHAIMKILSVRLKRIASSVPKADKQKVQP